ncbi:DUF1993 domain-containing protein [Phreatobacter sp. AB_2022a]|uniref:DUF1993 domain-containing protein n=1 Tax=Phreatobacter sp. AB_2022a TaxID=3003134 RepID=UPI0022871C72|nr:DUF1993 domain-containing protein [Phreatobacter sp. AB_2022a]MCZ0735697.1 DUF1993 domain-containing protein [Phreatobacter sp. AB_2022a]
MTTKLSDLSVPIFVQMLTSLSALLDKAATFAEAKKIDAKVLLESRLAPDMFPFTRQVQLATDFAKGPCARLAGMEPPKYPDVETTIAELKGRIAKTIAFVTGLDKAVIDAADDKDVTITIGGQPMTFKGKAYLAHMALPNFYFHVTMAYAILRENGLDIGKRDYVGKLPA